MVQMQDGYIQVTQDCNQECIFCSQPKADKYLSIEEIKKQILEYKKLGFTSIVITGGEPTLHNDLLGIIRFIKSVGLEQRMITNAIKLADKKLCKDIVDAGLTKVIVSIHTNKRDVNERITGKDYLKERLEGIRNLIDLQIQVFFNTTIFSENYAHLSEFIGFMIKEYPQVPHYVLNFVDGGGRSDENVYVMPKLSDVELELGKTLQLLSINNKTMRVERVPLCYMCDFEENSSETRRIIGDQQYHTFFIEENAALHFGSNASYNASYNKADACSHCFMTSICAGIKNPYLERHGTSELYPLFKSPKPLIDKGIKD